MRTTEEIKESLKTTRDEWIKNGKMFNRYKPHTQQEKQAETRKLIQKIMEDLKELKEVDPEEFELFYWENYMIVARDTICNDSYSGILSVLALVVSAVSMVFTALNTFYWVLVVCACIMAVALIIIVIWYLKCTYATRERSYYHFLLAAAAELRKPEEEKEMHITHKEEQ